MRHCPLQACFEASSLSLAVHSTDRTPPPGTVHLSFAVVYYVFFFSLLLSDTPDQCCQQVIQGKEESAGRRHRVRLEGHCCTLSDETTAKQPAWKVMDVSGDFIPCFCVCVLFFCFCWFLCTSEYSLHEVSYVFVKSRRGSVQCKRTSHTKSNY